MVNSVRMWSNAAVLSVFLVASFVALIGIASPTYWFPAFVAVAGTLVTAYNLLADGRKLKRGGSLTKGDIVDIGASLDHGDEEAGDGAEMRKRIFIWVLWLVALPVLALVIPFFYASLLWLVAVFRLQAKKSWKFVVLGVVIFGILLNVIVVALDIRLPPSLFGLG